MSFTRFHDDKHRIKKQVEESIYAGDYMINAPGPGVDLPFMEDSQIRLQKWGANLRTNTVNLENDLKGLTRTLNRDELTHEYTRTAVPSRTVQYKHENPFIDESRASHPAWVLRDLEQNRWEHPLLNPQDKLTLNMPTQLQSRILEKDFYVPKVPVVQGTNDYYLTGQSICIGGKEDSCPGTLYENKIH